MHSELPETTTAWVKAFMQPLYKKKIIKEQVGTRTVTKTKGIFNKTSFEAEEAVYESKEEWVPTGEYSDTEINIEKFSSDINKMCQELAASGYKVTQIIPINSGRYRYDIRKLAAGNASWEIQRQ